MTAAAAPRLRGLQPALRPRSSHSHSALWVCCVHPCRGGGAGRRDPTEANTSPEVSGWHARPPHQDTLFSGRWRALSHPTRLRAAQKGRGFGFSPHRDDPEVISAGMCFWQFHCTERAQNSPPRAWLARGKHKHSAWSALLQLQRAVIQLAWKAKR